MSKRPNWQQHSREAMETFIGYLQEELGEGATLEEIEQAMLRHYQELLSEVMQALVRDQGTFPPGAKQS